MNHQVAAIKLAKSKGINPAKMSKLQHTLISLEIRSASEIVRDGFHAAKSIVQTSIGLHVLPSEIVLRRKEKCLSNECGSYSPLDDGTPRCYRCSCAGVGLEAKQSDDREDCPGGFWEKLERGADGRLRTKPD